MALMKIEGSMYVETDYYACQAQQMIICQLMSSHIRTHRRNKAHQQQENRFSFPVHMLDFNRGSFQPNYANPLTLRSSDVGGLGSEKHLAKKSKGVGEITSAKSIGGRGQSTLLATLRNLQWKLLQAKKQFCPTQGREHNSYNFQLNSFQESSSGGSKWGEQSLLQKLQESTINLESQKKLMDAMKSKERIIWAHKIKTYYIAQLAKAIVGINERANEHLAISLEILKSCLLLSLPALESSKVLNLPLLAQDKGKKTLVLDLDETLLHCSEERNSPQDIEINLQLDPIDKGFVSLRPFAISFLKRMSKHFEIIVFTASEKSYADTILNEFDPEYQLIRHRLYRQHCVRLNSKIYAKDLRIIGRDLSQVVLVDNSPFSYLYQVDNGIPILPYYFGEDTELLSLQKYLQQVSKAEDVRKLNRETFKLQRYREFEEGEQLVKQLYCTNY